MSDFYLIALVGEDSGTEAADQASTKDHLHSKT